MDELGHDHAFLRVVGLPGVLGLGLRSSNRQTCSQGERKYESVEEADHVEQFIQYTIACREIKSSPTPTLIQAESGKCARLGRRPLQRREIAGPPFLRQGKL